MNYQKILIAGKLRIEMASLHGKSTSHLSLSTPFNVRFSSLSRVVKKKLQFDESEGRRLIFGCVFKALSQV